MGLCSTLGRSAARRLTETFSPRISNRNPRLAAALWRDFAGRGYRDLRERPILALADGGAAILDPTFFGEKIAIGPLFHLLARARGGKANEIFGAFGLAFEDYANAILRRMYPDCAGLASRLRCSVTGRDREGRDFDIDAVLNDVRQVVVFEEKAAWLKDEVVLGDMVNKKIGTPPPSSSMPSTKQRRPGTASMAARSIPGSTIGWAAIPRCTALRCFASAEDFGEIEYYRWRSPAWPLAYEDFEPYYCEAERMASGSAPAPASDAMLRC
jgi:hypothetical protein